MLCATFFELFFFLNLKKSVHSLQRDHFCKYADGLGSEKREIESRNYEVLILDFLWGLSPGTSSCLMCDGRRNRHFANNCATLLIFFSTFFQECLKEKIYLADRQRGRSAGVAQRGRGRCPHGPPVKCK